MAFKIVFGKCAEFGEQFGDALRLFHEYQLPCKFGAGLIQSKKQKAPCVLFSSQKQFNTRDFCLQCYRLANAGFFVGGGGGDLNDG